MKKFTSTFWIFLALITLTTSTFANNDKPVTAPDSYLRDAIIYNFGQEQNVKIDLYVMSQCPYGVKAEKALVPILKEMGSKVEFNIFFIANVKGNNEFQALHGQPEVMENRRQLVIARHFSDKFLDYLTERAEDYRKDDWTIAGKAVGLDINKVNELVESQTEIDAFTRNLTFGNIKKIYGSPSLFINGKQYRGTYAEKQKLLKQAEDDPGTCSGGANDGAVCDTDNGDGDCDNICVDGNDDGVIGCNDDSGCDNLCVGGSEDGDTNCSGDGDCDNECQGGINDGLTSCGNDDACNGCSGGSEVQGAGCFNDSDCSDACVGGGNAGGLCEDAFDCENVCTGGSNPGANCDSGGNLDCDGICVGGTNNNNQCDDNFDCPGGTCSQGTCDVGTCTDIGTCDDSGTCDMGNCEIGTCDIGTCTPDALPVELANFKAFVQDDNTVLLRWTTLSEINNKGFEVQHSRDGKTWETIDFIEGKGQSLERVNYRWVDNNAEVGINYYRLKQIDFDGKFEIHKTVGVEITSTSGLTVQAFPNPTSGVSTLYIPSNIEGEIIIYVINTAGKPVKIIRQNVQKGENLLFLDLNELGIGFYHIAVEHDKQLKVKSDIMVVD